MNPSSTIKTIARAASEITRPALTRSATKPVARAGLLSALSVAAAAMCAAVPARAEQVAVAIQGSVLSGTDYTGMFGGRPNSSLAGEPFAMNCIMDADKGVESVQSVPGAALPYFSQIKDTAVLIPMICAVTIKGTSVSVGAAPPGTVDSRAWRNVGSKPAQAGFELREANVGKGFSELFMQLSLPNLSPTDYQWNKSAYYSNIGGSSPAKKARRPALFILIGTRRRRRDWRRAGS